LVRQVIAFGWSAPSERWGRISVAILGSRWAVTVVLLGRFRNGKQLRGASVLQANL